MKNCCEFIATFCEPCPMKAEFDEAYFIGEYDPYLGPYRVIPKAFQEQILKTKEKSMTDNVTVEEVPYTEVSNVEGTTVIIATE